MGIFSSERFAEKTGLLGAADVDTLGTQTAILGLCQPLLDISDEVDMGLVTRYGLKMNDAVLAEEKHQPLFRELVDRPGVKYVVGGATQNSIRVAQWLLQKPGASAFMGCIGADDFGIKMKALCDKEGVRAAYMVDEDTPTGCCAVLVNNSERSMCTSLKAANNYRHEHLMLPENLELLREAKIVYSAGYFITTSPESIEIASSETVETGAFYCMNLSAPFLMHVAAFKAIFDRTMPYVDFLFGNESEARAWAESEGWETTDVAFIALRLSLIPSVKARKRTVVITQGPDDTIVCINGKVTLHPVVKLQGSQIVDTNGAGDAYVGGFLAALSKDLPLADCCKVGAYSASVIIQHCGCTFPAKPEYSM